METTRLYHFTTENYSPGQIIVVPEGEFSFSYSQGGEKNKQTIDYFDEYASIHYPNYVPRKKAVFAFDNPRYAFWYNHEGHIYEVDMKVSYRGPFVLVNTLMQFIDNKNKADAFLKDYYNPDYSVDKNEWYAFEYLGNEMTIIQRIDFKTCIDSFSADREKSERLFGNAQNSTRGLIC